MSYFYKKAEACKHFKVVSEIQYQGQEIKDFEGIKIASHSFFKYLYMDSDEDPIDSKSYHLSLVPQLVQYEDNLRLTALINMQELKNSLGPWD